MIRNGLGPSFVTRFDFTNATIHWPMGLGVRRNERLDSPSARDSLDVWSVDC